MKTGDLVALKSGGPLMTVNSMTREDKLVSCEWFSGERLRRDSFDRECLVTLDEIMEKEGGVAQTGTIQ